MLSLKPWNLVADIGGTNARFSVENCGNGELELVKAYSVSDHDAFTDALDHFLTDVKTLGDWEPLPDAACLAVACPVEIEQIRFTNSPWAFTRADVGALLGSRPLELINDFAAVGYAIPELTEQDWQQIGGGCSRADKPIAVLGPGTGLGVCAVVPNGSGAQVITGEGGHVDFAPVGTLEMSVLEQLNRCFERVSVERLLSGDGLVNLYNALAVVTHKPAELSTAAQISEVALRSTDTLANTTLQVFCRVLGSVAGDLALTFGALGGVYVAGGIVPRFVDFLTESDVRHRFESKGRFKSYLAEIPLRVVTREHLGLMGAAKRLNLRNVAV